MSANAAHFDDNQVPTSMGAIGTLGTADTGGTAKALPLSVDGTTGAAHVYLVTKLDSTNDSVTIGGGTLNAGTVTVTLNTGTITAIAAGTLNTLGTVGTLNGIAAGDNNIGNVDVVTGTQQLLTTLSNLTNGSVNVLTGTIQNSGTTTGVGVVSALTNGSVNVLTGTVTSITNLAGGTVKKNETPVNIGTPYHVLGTTGVAVWGTIVAASGAGTYQYVSGVDIVVSSGTVDVAVTNIGVGGSTGAGVLARGQFTPGGGISKNFDPVQRSGTNGTLSYWLGGAGTAGIDIQYWQAT